MSRRELLRLLRDVRKGKTSPSSALARLAWMPVEDLGFARLDTHRELRKGVPEVVFCQGKTVPQAAAIIRRLVKSGGRALATRASEALFRELSLSGIPVRYDPPSRVLIAGVSRPAMKGAVAVLCAGTADIPVAEEAALTAEFAGVRVRRSYDVGVAGLHRIMNARKLLTWADAVVVAAGMEGALPSVVAGLTEAPVIAVPTRIGYGAGFLGLSALLTMINSCAPGIAVVNIDNGFGAGYMAAAIARPRRTA